MKKEERQAIIAFYYTQNKEIAKKINNEAKKNSIDPFLLIDNIGETRESALNFLKYGMFPHELKLKKQPKRLKKIYTHAEIENLIHDLYKTKRITSMGKDTIEGDNVEIWIDRDVQYIVKVDDLPKLENRPPKVYVSQIKNIYLLMALTQEQQLMNFTKEAKCRFKLSYYAKRRGYTDEQIRKGGKLFEELKRDLFTGAYTTYRIDKVIIEGKEYTAHGIPNFYILFEPKDRKNEWGIQWNKPYDIWLLQILNKEARQYFIKNPKAIEDLYTSDRPYLFLFYMQLSKRKQNNLFTKPLKIGNLLKDMKLPDKILSRPKECFKVLKECLIYYSENYKPTPELESFKIYNDYRKTETLKIPISISEAFKKYEYGDFKDLIKNMGLKDLREAYISFKRPYKKIKKTLNEEERALLARVLKWFKGQITKIPYRDQESLITKYILKLGYDDFKEIFEIEANKYSPNAVEFLTKVLPNKNRAKSEAENKAQIAEMANELFNS